MLINPDDAFVGTLEYEHARQIFIACELFTCDECGKTFTDAADLTGGVCGNCWNQFRLIETGH